MAMTTADLLVERLIDWGVDIIFGFPRDGVNGIFEALRTRQDRIRFIQARHEEAAAFAACGYAKYSRRLGVCLATSGPGGIHLPTSMDTPSIAARLGWRGNRDRMRIEGLVPSMSIRLSLVV